jgi:ribokinase
MLTVFGSINLDVSVRSPRLPQAGETLMGSGALLSPGGKGANQAHAAQRFGVATRLFGMVGGDTFATPAMSCLVNAGLDLSGVGVSPSDATGLAVITVSDSGDNTIVVVPGANLAARAAQVNDAALQASCVLLLQLEVPAAESFALARRAQQLGCKVILNPSPLPAGFNIDASSVDMLIVNAFELAQLSAQDQATAIEPIEQARTLARSLNMDVLVTLGAKGAFLAHRDGAQTTARALPITPVDTTGAGDTFAGVFAAATAGGETPQRAMQWATVAAGLACLRPGAQAAQPDRKAIEERIARLP